MAWATMNNWYTPSFKGSQQAQDVKIAVFADVHVEIDPSFNSCDPAEVPNAIERLEYISAEINTWGADGVINLGDFCRDLTTLDGVAALNIWKGLPTETVCVFGNHDADNQTKGAYTHKMGMNGSYYYKDIKGVRVIVLDSLVTPEVPPYHQLMWLSSVVRSTTNKCILAIHYMKHYNNLLFDFIFKENEVVGYIKIVAVLFGHTHMSQSNLIQETINGVMFIECNSTSYRFVGGADQLAWYKSPPPFGFLSIRKNGKLALRGFGESNNWASNSQKPDNDTYQKSIGLVDDYL